MYPSDRANRHRSVRHSVALFVGAFGAHLSYAQTYPLPDVGRVDGCAITVRVFAGGSGDHGCATSQATYLQSQITMPFLQSKCPDGQRLRGAYNNSCTDRPNRNNLNYMSSNYNATLCCGHVRQTPTYTPYVVPSPRAPSSTITFRAGYGIGGNLARTTPCPQLGVFHRRDAVSYVPMVRIQLPNMDKQCVDHGAPGGLASVIFHSCVPSVNGPQFGYHTQADVTCAQQSER